MRDYTDERPDEVFVLSRVQGTLMSCEAFSFSS